MLNPNTPNLTQMHQKEESPPHIPWPRIETLRNDNPAESLWNLIER